MAKQTFLQQQKITSENFPFGQWPLLNKLLNRGLSLIDLYVAERLLRPYPHANESMAAFICYLFLATRTGHICIKENHIELSPTLQECIIDAASDTAISAEELALFTKLIQEGLQQLPEQLIQNIQQFDPSSIPISPICRYKNLIYFQKYFLEEYQFIQRLLSLLDESPTIVLDSATMSHRLHHENLNHEQRQAILAIGEKRLTLICGGPGTGKTFTAGKLIKACWDALPKEKQVDFQISVAAPTGKAAMNLQNSLLKSFLDYPELASLKATTVHSLLGLKGHMKPKEPKFLSEDLILIDESSMLDLSMMSQLLASLKKGSRLILLGDPFQLPAVGSGMLFADIAKHWPANKIELRTCLRTEIKAIVNFAEQIKQGNVSNCISTLQSNQQGLKWVDIAFKGKILELISQYALTHLVPNSALLDSPNELFDYFNQFRMLSPLRKGPFGIDAINNLIINKIKNLKLTQDFIGIPIILTKSDQKQGIFNGEIGVLMKQNPFDHTLQKGDYALFPDREVKGAVRTIPAFLLPSFEYAYCLSVHKSQGSEFENILLLLPEGSENFGRELLYTACTRSRKGLEIWGLETTISKAISKQCKRLSQISTLDTEM